jgi:hypothetical protein
MNFLDFHHAIFGLLLISRTWIGLAFHKWSHHQLHALLAHRFPKLDKFLHHRPKLSSLVMDVCMVALLMSFEPQLEHASEWIGEHVGITEQQAAE